MRGSKLFRLLFILPLLGLLLIPAPAQAQASYNTVGYLQGWCIDNIPGVLNNIDFSKLTHVIYASGYVDDTVTPELSCTHWDYVEDIRDEVHAEGGQMLISCYDNGARYSVIAYDPAKVAAFAADVLAKLNAHNIDGIDIEWSPPEAPFGTTTGLDNIVNALYAVLHPAGYIITVAGNPAIIQLGLTAFAKVDLLDIMSYDLSHPTGSTYSNAVTAVDTWGSAGYAKSKITMGVPFYATDSITYGLALWSDVVANLSPPPSDGENTRVTATIINWTGAPVAVQGGTLGWNGVDLIKQKAAYVKANGYGGMMCFDVGEDDFSTTSLLDVIYTELNGTPPPSTTGTYKGQILIQNTSSATTNNAVPFTLSTANMISAGMLNATATDAYISSGATQVKFMPGWGANPWIIFIPSVGANGSQYDTLYSNDVTPGDVRFFPDNAGMTTTYSATLELGDDFEVEARGFINTAAGTNKNLVRKSSAFGVKVSAAQEITACFWPDINQTASNSLDAVSTWAAYKQRAGQRVNAFIGTVESVQVKLNKINSPNGTGYLRVRKVSDDSVIGTLGTINVATLTGVATLYTFDTTPIVVTPEQDIRISFEYGGGSDTDYVQIQNQGSDVCIGQYASYTAAAWTDTAGTDLTIIASASQGFGKRVVATGVTAAEHTIRVKADAANLKIYLDTVLQDTEALAGASVPSNANDWYYLENYAVPYMEYVKMTVSGTLQQYIIWEYAATFNDQSAGNHDATPTFRTTTTDADVTATLQNLGPAVTQTPPAGGSAGVWNLIPAVPTAPGSLYTELGMTFFGAGVCQMFSTYTGTPLAIPVFGYAFGLAIFIGLACYRLSMGSKRNGQYSRKGSLFIQSTVSGLVLWYFVANGGGVIPGLVLIPFGVLAVACMVWEKSPYPWS